jgi:CHASE3 domain sensor protein
MSAVTASLKESSGFSIFQNIKIRARIFAGFGALIVLGAAIASYGVLRLSAVATQVGLLSTISEGTGRVLDADKYAETMRRGVVRYRLDGNEAALRDIDNSIAETNTRITASVNALEQLQQVMTDPAALASAEARKGVFKSIRAKLQVEKAMVDAFVAVSKEGAASRSRLISEGEGLKPLTVRLLEFARNAQNPALFEAAAGVDTAVLHARLASWRFLATNDPAGSSSFPRGDSQARQDCRWHPASDDRACEDRSGCLFCRSCDEC